MKNILHRTHSKICRQKMRLTLPDKILFLTNNYKRTFPFIFIPRRSTMCSVHRFFLSLIALTMMQVIFDVSSYTLHAQNGWRYIGPVDRQVQNLAVNGDIIFCTAIDPPKGGIVSTAKLYRSTDSGLTWMIIDSLLFPKGAHEVLLIPDSNRHVISIRPSAKHVLYSTDLGETWDTTRSTPPLPISRLFLKLNTPGLIFAIGESFFSRDRLFRSTDYGRIWTEPYIFPASSDGSDLAVGMSPTTGDMYVNDDTNIGGNFFFHSSDNGNSWSWVGFTESITDIVVDPLDVAIIYAIAAGNVIPSTNSGITWDVMFQGSIDRYAVTMLQPLNNRDVFLLLTQGTRPGLFISQNHGQQWVFDTLSSTLPYKEILSPFNPISWMQYDHKKNRLYLQTKKGVYVRENVLTGIKESELQTNSLKVDLFPQPAKEQVFFRVSHAAEKPVHIQVYNALGVLVQEMDGQNGQPFAWNLIGRTGQRAHDGFYLIVFRSMEKVIIKKMLVQH